MLNAFAAFWIPLPAAAAEYADELVSKASSLSLSSAPQWLALLHYEQHFLSRRPRSTAVSSPFFAASNGRFDSSAELAATIKSFFADGQCRFPARYAWLRRRLDFDPQRLPPSECPDFTNWASEINAGGITIVFPSSFLNNPASAFGHTLLRLDRAGQGTQSGLIPYAANFAAETHGENALLYAIKGVFGGFDGYYSIAPYYRMVRMYNDIESRDMWEYQLDFSAEEAALLVQHLWELRNVAFEYYYFDRNCSYQLLALLEAARPSMRLREAFHGAVMPVDTIREVLKQPGILRTVAYRPSASRVLRARMQRMSNAAVRSAKAMATADTAIDEMAEYSAEQQGDILDLAFEFTSYREVRGDEDEESARKKGYQLLRARNRLPETPSLTVTPPGRPDLGHRSFRARVETGVEEDREFYGFNFRPAYHDLLDPPAGYEPGSEIDFFEVGFRQYEGEEFQLKRVVPLRIISLTPRNILLKPWSWEIRTELEREPVQGKTAVRLAGGMGVTESISTGTFGYLLVNAASVLKESESALGPGARGGFLCTLGDRAGFQAEASLAYLPWGVEDTDVEILGQGRFSLSDAAALRPIFKRRMNDASTANEFSLAFDWYF